MIEHENLFLIDSNILVYAYNSDDPVKQQRTRKLLDACWDRRIYYAISTQNMSEFFVTLTKKIKRPVGIDETHQIIQDIVNFSHFIKITITPATILAAIALHKKTKCPYYDSLIVATMMQNGIFNVYTENIKDFSKIDGITAVNPLI